MKRSVNEQVLSDSDRPYAAQLSAYLDALTKAYLFEPWSMESDLFDYILDSTYAKTGSDFDKLAEALYERVDYCLTTEASAGN